MDKMSYIEVVCFYCGKTFSRELKMYNRAIKNNNKQFCSLSCQHGNKQTKIDIHCDCCGKIIRRSKKEIENSKSGKFFCSHSCHAKIAQIGRKQTKETKEKISKSIIEFSKTEKFKEVNNKNKQRYINKRIKKMCPICNKEFSVCKSSIKQIYCSKECCESDKNFKYRKRNGGYRKGSGRGKKGWYKSYRCDSSWELAYVIYNLEHNIKFTRNNEGFEYQYEDKTYRYYPDFILEDGIYVEIKGVLDKKNQAKIASFKKPLKVLYKKEMQEYLKYVIDKYGKNFIELYEGHPHKQRNNKCLVCGKSAKNKYCSRSCCGKQINKLFILKKIHQIGVRFPVSVPILIKLKCF